MLVVACALLDNRGQVLLAKRPEGKTLAGFWEFPGGKVFQQLATITHVHAGGDVQLPCRGQRLQRLVRRPLQLCRLVCL
jgi:adenine-specific DNA glycosylase